MGEHIHVALHRGAEHGARDPEALALHLARIGEANDHGRPHLAGLPHRDHGSLDRRNGLPVGQQQRMHLHGQPLDGNDGDADGIRTAVVQVGMEGLGGIEQLADDPLIPVVHLAVELLVGEFAVQRGACAIERRLQGREGAVQPAGARHPLQMPHVGAEEALIIEPLGMEVHGRLRGTHPFIAPGQRADGVRTEAFVGDGLHAAQDGVVVELHIAPVHAVVATDEVEDGVVPGQPVHVKDLRCGEPATAEGVHQPHGFLESLPGLFVLGDIAAPERIHGARLIGRERLIVAQPVHLIEAVLPEQGGVEPEDGALRPSIPLQQFGAEVLLEGVDPQVLPIELHADEAVAQRRHTLGGHQAMVEPVAEVVARAGVLQREALHAHEAAILPGHHAEAPFAALYMVGELALDAQLGLEGLPIAADRGRHIAVALGQDDAPLAGLIHHALELLHVVVVHGNRKADGLHREAGGVVPHPLAHEYTQPRMIPLLQQAVAQPSARTRKDQEQACDVEPAPSSATPLRDAPPLAVFHSGDQCSPFAQAGAGTPSASTSPSSSKAGSPCTISGSVTTVMIMRRTMV